MVFERAGPRVVIDLIDVITEDAPPEPCVPIAQRLKVIQVPAVIPSVPDIQQCTDHRARDISHVFGNRIYPADVFVDFGSEFPVWRINRRFGRVMGVLDCDANPSASGLLKNAGVGL